MIRLMSAAPEENTGETATGAAGQTADEERAPGLLLKVKAQPDTSSIPCTALRRCSTGLL